VGKKKTGNHHIVCTAGAKHVGTRVKKGEPPYLAHSGKEAGSPFRPIVFAGGDTKRNGTTACIPVLKTTIPSLEERRKESQYLTTKRKALARTLL